MSSPISRGNGSDDIKRLLDLGESSSDLSVEEQDKITSTVQSFLAKHPGRSITAINTDLLDRVTVSYKDRGDKSIKTAQLMLS